MWCVANWASRVRVQPQPLAMQHSVLVLVVFGWMMSTVEEESRHYLAADNVDGAVIIAAIGRMQV